MRFTLASPTRLRPLAAISILAMLMPTLVLTAEDNTPPPSTGSAAPSAEVRSLITLQHAWATARVQRDVAFLENLYAKEFRITSLNGSVVTRDADIAAFASGTLRPESVTNEDMNVSVYGDTAVVTGLEKMRGTYKGAFGEFGVRFTNVFVRRDGRWQLVAHQSTEVRKK